MKKFLSLNDSKLTKRLEKMHAYDIANYIMDAEPEALIRVVKLMKTPKLVDVFVELPQNKSKEIFKLFDSNLQKEILNEFEMDELKVFISSFSPEEQNDINSLLTTSKQAVLSTLMGYEVELIASIMTTEFLTIESSKTIKEATAYVIRNSEDNNYIDELFVTDKGKLIGSVSLKDLISARANDSLKDITYNIKESLKHTDSIYEGFKKFRDYSAGVLPVLDDNKIVGIVTADDVFNLMTEEYKENVLKLQAVGDYDLSKTLKEKALLRLPWLLVSVILNLVIAVVLSVFERTLTEVVTLILFQPMILGMAGNIGTQAISVTILKLKERELDEKAQLKKHISKEIGIGILNSLLIGLISFGVAFSILSLLKIADTNIFKLSLTVGISLFIAMLISAIAGVFIPIILAKLKIDPALASGPIISTINDLFALVVYFGVATIMFML